MRSKFTYLLILMWPLCLEIVKKLFFSSSQSSSAAPAALTGWWLLGMQENYQIQKLKTEERKKHAADR